MNLIIERLKLYCEHTGISYQTFAKGINSARQMFYKSHNIGSEKIIAIALTYKDLNLHWLFTGDGSMIRPLVNDESKDKLLEHLVNLDDTLTKEEVQNLYVTNLETLVDILEEKMKEIERIKSNIDFNRL